jgi:hypothetical protein
LYVKIKHGTVEGSLTRKRIMDDLQGLMHQAMLERMQMLEEALDRAEAGVATPDDWATIRMECGTPRRQSQLKTLRSE